MGEKLRIVIIDDNIDAADTCDVLLRGLGYATKVFYRAEGVLPEFIAFDPHLAIVDIGLPNVDGRAFARLVRARGKPIKLVSVSGWGKPHDVAANIEAGFDEHLTKPASVEAIMKLAATADLELQARAEASSDASVRQTR